MKASVAGTGEPVLSVRELSVSFGALLAVDRVSFDVARGGITSLIGPNGAGKSTVFNVISGALRPDAGRVVLEGRDVTGAPPYQILAAGLARSFQITNLFFELTVQENLRLAAQVLEPTARLLEPLRASARAQARVARLVDQFGLGDTVHELAGYLSHGEQRRLEIAVALACEPRVLLLDEPTQGMSRADTAATEALIKSLTGDVSILLIEHDVDLVMNLSDHVIVMHQGGKLAEGSAADVRADPAVRAAYLGKTRSA